jgi:hypothetical protein
VRTHEQVATNKLIVLNSEYVGFPFSLPLRPLRPLREALTFVWLRLALLDRNEGPGLGTDVVGIGANQFVIRSLFLDVR